MNRIVFRTIDSFDECYSRYQMHKCDKCDGLLEMSIEPIEVIIEDRFMQFKDLSILKCIKCESIYLNEFSKKLLMDAIKLCWNIVNIGENFGVKGIRKYMITVHI